MKFTAKISILLSVCFLVSILSIFWNIKFTNSELRKRIALSVQRRRMLERLETIYIQNAYVSDVHNLPLSNDTRNQRVPGDTTRAAYAPVKTILNNNLGVKFCNTCVDYTPYKPIIAPRNITQDQLEFVFLIYTKYAQEAYERRQFIRRTWANQTYWGSVRIQHVFTLGNPVLLASAETKLLPPDVLRFVQKFARFKVLYSGVRHSGLSHTKKVYSRNFL